ncbi:hypothetical protein F4804DRAFT_347093 [Jackrogersella minutella]|nr:hypothetical protein F4804DRAFT_347093 [Jackrogersella minutella]
MPPRTRNKTPSSTSGNVSTTENHDSKLSSNSKANTSKTTSRGRKRKSTESDPSDNPKGAKQARKPDAPKPDVTPNEDQLRESRPTPGRIKRPRYSSFRIPEGFKDRFYVPKPVKPKGRLNALQKHKMYIQTTMLDPSETFHDLHACHRKGRNGSPTCDSAGFQLDWNKVDDWMHPPSYTKSRAVTRMERRVEEMDRKSRKMRDIFFVDGNDMFVDDYLKDHVSKDLGIPWHQIGPEQLLEEPNEVEKARMSNMSSGCLLRKDL